MNSVNLVGRVAKDAQVSNTALNQAGDYLITLDLAVTARVKEVSGQWNDKGTIYVSVSIFTKKPENIKYFTKGKFVSIQGSLQQPEPAWIDDNGKVRNTNTRVLATKYSFYPGTDKSDVAF